MKHALCVAFHYPPEASSSGVLRTLKYTRYLVDHGWRTTVIAPAVDAYTTVDAELERQIPPTTRVLRTRYFNTKRHLAVRGLYPSIFAIPDRWIGWLPWGVRAGRRLLADDPFDLVYSTSPHATAHLIAWRVAKRARKPWVADFRDPWIEDPPEPGAPTGRVYTAANRWLERRVAQECSAVVASTFHLKETLATRYPTLPAGKITAILNGYDEADFEDLPTCATATRERLVLLHAGSINREFRNPIPLLRAARALADAANIDLARIRFRFLGPGDFAFSREMSEALDELRMRDTVEFLPRVPYSQSLAALAEADLLLLLQSSPDTTGLVPAKLYEYLRAQKPVLAMVHRGATDEVLSLTGGGWSVAPESQEALGGTLASAYSLWLQGDLAKTRANLSVLSRFDRKALAGELAGLFESVVDRCRMSQPP